MGAVQDGFDTWLRDNVVEGNPTSGVNQPSKSEGRAIGGLIEQAIASAVSAAVSAGGAAKIILDVTPETGTIGTGTKHTVRMPYGVSLSEVRASLTTAGGSATVIDITVKQTEADTHATILSAALQIDASATTSVGSAAPAAIQTHALNDNAEIHIDVTTDGGGAGLKVYLIGSWAAIGVGAIPYLVGLATGNGGLNNVATANYPTGFDIEADDIALLSILGTNTAGGTPVITRPSGWSTVANPAGGGLANEAMAVFWRRLDGTESGSFTVSMSAGTLNGMSVQMSIWRGCVQNGDPFESALGDAASASSTMEGTPIVTLGPNRLGVNLYMLNDAIASDPDTGWTEAFDGAIDGPDYSSQHACSVVQMPLAGTTPAETRTITATRNWSSLSLALVPGTD